MYVGIIVKSTSTKVEILLNRTLELGEFLIIKDEKYKNILFKIVGLEYRTEALDEIDYSDIYPLLNESAGEYKGNSYLIADCKPVCIIDESGIRTVKTIPRLYSKVNTVSEENMKFLYKNGIFIGKLRNGSDSIDVDVKIDSKLFIPHHILISANTGKGKSNLLKVMLWSIIEESNMGVIVMDPHGEYSASLEKHQLFNDRVRVYSAQQKNSAETLVINTDTIQPSHFEGIMSFTDAQMDLAYILYKQIGNEWIRELFNDNNPFIKELINNRQVQPITVKTLQRKMMSQLGLKKNFKGKVFTNEPGVGENTINNIVKHILNGMSVIIDTSRLYENVEMLICGIVASNIFVSQMNSMEDKGIQNLTPVAIVLEEAPKVIGDATGGENIFKRIAKEGRKFGIGLIAVTQMASLIPKEILANMNTKIILGNDSASERSVIINSAPQDLSQEDREIATLEKGEGIISSSLLSIAIPFKAPLIESFYKNKTEKRIEL
ncbi:MAG: ATP-binding protein [Candidatus Thermoplasmatota archaeon]|nr:ATP-binding protein [Candidatus Thermoplasmatota archaeon]MCL5964096.1 ATP-binding protein [Candidatus Thermoplasmatota archaeon]